MMKEFRWFWAWQDEKEEVWLREMSQNGWHFASVSFPGFFTFTQGEPTDYVYRLDYLTDKKEFGSYLQIFEDANWDYMGNMNGWQYFRQESIKGEAPEIFTDNESKSKKYQRIMLFLVILFPVLFNSVVMVGKGAENSFLQFFSLFMGLILILYAYGTIKLLQRISHLKKKI
ncbi:MAG: DUF2812 domain-containing protein [Chloroflexi bacterium]|nr:MAG: DUF2812 domain-containing protein [Chloroflexota bacterium]